VQSWVDNPATNFGWVLRGDETSSGSAKRFDSRQNSVPSFRPSLSITFTLPSTRPPGDVNDDGMVNRTDLPLFWDRFSLETALGFDGGDFNGDGRADLIDLALLQSRYATVEGSPVASPVAVPEPSSGAVCFVAVAFVAATGIRRKRRVIAV
jgi:hypothetical protein